MQYYIETPPKKKMESQRLCDANVAAVQNLRMPLFPALPKTIYDNYKPKEKTQKSKLWVNTTLNMLNTENM